MSTFTTKDGTSIYDKDWGAGQPIVFVPDATLTVLEGAPHGLCVTHADAVNAEPPTFIRGESA